MTDHVDVLDLASELDLQKMERLMSRHENHRLDIVYSPYILLVWKDKDKFQTVRIAYFEKQSEKDMKLAEEILNSQTVIHQDLDVRFPFAFFKWTE